VDEQVCETCLQFIPDEDFSTLYGECVFHEKYYAHRHYCDEWKPRVRTS
jgi:hypothetical protein